MATLSFVSTVGIALMADVPGQAALFLSNENPIEGVMLEPVFLAKEAADGDNVRASKIGEWSYCQYDLPEELELAVDVLAVDVDPDLQPGQAFMVDVTMKNNSNVRLVNADSQCGGKPVVNLGTRGDYESRFGTDELALSGWVSANRVKMHEDYVEPGEVFHAIYQSVTPEGDNIYREFYQPVVEDQGWVDEAFALDVEVGEPSESMRDNISYVTDLPIAASDLEGLERTIEVIIAEQKLYAKFGDYKVWSMTISSGHYTTPTPPGHYEILNKQELRVGGQPPHFRMPYWMGFRTDGYGLHALPYLGKEQGGYYWQEAESHIGLPVSHGCVRIPTDYASVVYKFADVGTPLWIH